MIPVNLLEGQQYDGILITPNSDEKKKLKGLVLVLHGGPHSCSVAVWPRRDIGLLLQEGYAILQVNYHGSLGYGENFVVSHY